MAIYLDNNASTPILARVASKVHQTMLECYGNPSSPHFAGDSARAVVEEARLEVQNLTGLASHRVLFTGSGSEANTLVLSSLLKRNRNLGPIFCSVIEHSSVLRTIDLYNSGSEVHWLPLAKDGSVVLSQFEAMLGQMRPAFVSLQWVNNETGVVQPIERISEICFSHSVPFHCDASQAVGKMLTNNAEKITFLTATGHKVHGPQGVGFVMVHPSAPEIIPLIGGGEQEWGFRPGTENVAGLAGLAEAARLRRANIESDINHMKLLRDLFERQIEELVPRARVNFQSSERVCNTSSVTFVGCDGQALMHRLSEAGIACSQSSACESSSPVPSHVLKALGFSDTDAFATLRFSVSPLNSQEDIEECVQTLAQLVTTQLRFFSQGLRFETLKPDEAQT